MFGELKWTVKWVCFRTEMDVGFCAEIGAAMCRYAAVWLLIWGMQWVLKGTAMGMFGWVWPMKWVLISESEHIDFETGERFITTLYF